MSLKKKTGYKKHLEKYNFLDKYGTLQLAKYERDHPLDFYKWLQAKKMERAVNKYKHK